MRFYDLCVRVGGRSGTDPEDYMEASLCVFLGGSI
jgi:hypothetical protein